MKLIIAKILTLAFLFTGCGKMKENTVEQWSVFEQAYYAPGIENPYTPGILTAVFEQGLVQLKVSGFYDGNDTFRIRFMPDRTGTWHYRLSSEIPSLNELTGSFECTPAGSENHGPVKVYNRHHFRYADGTRYFQAGTTCYAWVHQGDSMAELTLKTLASSPFNKLRMCIFPKDYEYNRNEPECYPFPRDTAGNNDYSGFDPDFWKMLEKRILQLQELGIEADLILFHPYDRWGYSYMPDSVDEFYLKYALARLSAFRNVWWSVANEFDFMRNKTMDDWHRYFEIIYRNDPYNHLASIHNGAILYDHSLPWVSHASIQSTMFEKAPEWFENYDKPIIFDECRYEGDVVQGWGNLSPEEMTSMFWKSLVRGTYAGHGETYMHPEDVLWWSKGGTLHGKSPERIAFYKEFLKDIPEYGFDPVNENLIAKPGEYYLYYFEEEGPGALKVSLPETAEFSIEIADTWNMRIDTLEGRFKGDIEIHVPLPYTSIRIKRTSLLFPMLPVETPYIGNYIPGTATIKLTHAGSGTIRYTTDGTDPGPSSELYKDPVPVKDGTILKARAFDGDRSSWLFERQFVSPEVLSALSLTGLNNGLRYSYYEGEWKVLPDFKKLKALKTGTLSEIQLSVSERPDYYGVVYSGYIKVPSEGIYTFYTRSDDGSSLHIHGKQVVLNDGQHGVEEQFGQIALKAGYHPFELRYFDNWYDEFLEVWMRDPSGKLQKVTEYMLFY